MIWESGKKKGANHIYGIPKKINVILNSRSHNTRIINQIHLIYLCDKINGITIIMIP